MVSSGPAADRAAVPLTARPHPQADDDSVLSILVASDLHLGYLEKDPIRGDDSFATFNEVFQLANDRKASRARARILQRHG